MAYELRPGVDWSHETRRIMSEQIALAHRALTDTADKAKGVHEARKAIKRARAMLRLIYATFDDRVVRKHDRRLREIAQSLSGARDAQAMLETLSALENRYGRQWNVNLLQGLRATFHGRKQRSETLLAPVAERTAGKLEKEGERISRLTVSKGEKAMRAGIRKTYSRARMHFGRAYETGAGAAFHEWRKDAQRHWRQMQLVVAAWPEEMNVRIGRAEALSKCLGEDHDLHMLLGHVRFAGAEIAGWDELERFFDGCIERQAALRLRAQGHGQLLFAERPSAFGARIARYWDSAKTRFGQGIAIQPEDEFAPGVAPRLVGGTETDSGAPARDALLPREVTRG